MDKADNSTQSGLVHPNGDPIKESASVTPGSPNVSGLNIFKFALKAAAVAFVPLSIGVGTAYYQAWWGAFGLDESLLRGDFLNLHLVTLNLAMKAYGAVAVQILIAVVGIIVLGYVGSLLAEVFERKVVQAMRAARAEKASETDAGATMGGSRPKSPFPWCKLPYGITCMCERYCVSHPIRG